MKISNESDLQCNLTFFEPPKEENAFSQSGLFQSVIGFFNSKKSQTSNISKGCITCMIFSIGLLKNIVSPCTTKGVLIEN